MTRKREYLDYLEDILEAAGKALNFIEEMTYEEFVHDDKTAFAVVRALEIIGEATKRVPEEIRAKYPQVPWRSMAGMRDKLIRDYVSINWEVVWKTVTKDVPVLKAEMRDILDDLESR